MCNTAPLLRIDFQVIKRRKQSDRRRQSNIVEELEEIERRNATETMRSGRMGSVEIPNRISSIP